MEPLPAAALARLHGFGLTLHTDSSDIQGDITATGYFELPVGVTGVYGFRSYQPGLLGDLAHGAVDD